MSMQIRHLLLVVMSLFAVFGCSKADDDASNLVTIEPPLLVDMTPANGTVDLPVGDVNVTLLFDQNITFLTSSASQIQVSGGTLKSCRALLKELKLVVNCAEKGATVTITIPQGLIKNTQGGEAASVSCSFTTVKPFEASLANIKTTPLTTNPAAVRLYQYFYEQYGKATISSVMANVNWNNECAEKVYKLTGKYPAMNCYDFIHIYFSPANWIDYTSIAPVKQWVDDGGIVQLMWHFNVPADEASSEGVENWNARPEKTTFKGSNALKEGTWENRIFYSQMDKVAATMLKLQEAGIAATWRPFHEAAGNAMAKTFAGKAWFWWGDEGPEVFKQLWIAMYDYFQQKGINNLIWIWTTQNYGNDPSSYDQDTSWYPGDKYVDMIARDLYGRNAADNLEEFTQIQQTYPTKMVALGECGYNTSSKKDGALIGDLWNAGALWSHFMVWYEGNSGSTSTMASDAWWKSSLSADCVITRDELPALK